MGKKGSKSRSTDWAEIPDTMEPQITHMTMETMGEDWVAAPPEEYECDLALYNRGSRLDRAGENRLLHGFDYLISF